MEHSFCYEKFKYLQSIGFNPKVIVDVGAYVGSWTSEMKTIFTDAKFIMLEANEEHERALQKVGEFFQIALLGHEDKQEVKFYTSGSGCTTGGSIYKENTSFYANNRYLTKKIAMNTLDSIAKNYHLDKIDLLKLDVQGSELDVLIGASEFLSNIEFIVLETQVIEYNCGAPMFNDVIDFMYAKKFQLFDTICNHYLPSGHLAQMDVLFVRQNSSFSIHVPNI